MEDGRIWPPLIILTLIIGGLFGFRYLEQVDKSNYAVQESKLAIQQTQENLAGRKAIWAKANASSLELNAAALLQQEATKLQDEADKKERLIEGDLKYLITSLNNSVVKIRADAEGQELGDLKLLNGKVLEQARIRKVDENSLSILHSNGISTITQDFLPPELLQKFDMGENSLRNELAAMARELGSVEQAPEKKTDDPRLTAVRKRIAQLDVQIESTTRHKDKLEAEVIDYDAKIKLAESTNQPTLFNLRTLRDIAEGNAGQSRNQLALLKAELGKLRAEETALLKK